jgi:hypothetical protein
MVAAVALRIEPREYRADLRMGTGEQGEPWLSEGDGEVVRRELSKSGEGRESAEEK